MQHFTLLLLFFHFTNLSAQDETLPAIEICKDVYFESPPDSTYKSYYVNSNQDTVYFRNNFCVVHHLITSPFGISLYSTKEGAAHGIFEWYMSANGSYYQMYGNFEKGRFMDGVFVKFYENGNVRSMGKYMNGVRAGRWKFYLENGCLDFEGMCEDGICWEIQD